MMGGCLGKKVPGSRQRKWLPKAARGGAGPGEPGSSIASYGRRGVESTRAGVAEGTAGEGAFFPLSREGLGTARVAMVTGHVPRGRGRGVRGGEGTCAGQSSQTRRRVFKGEMACEAPAPSIFDLVRMCPRPPIPCHLFVSNPPSHRMFCRRMGWPSSPKCRPPRAAPAKVEARARWVGTTTALPLVGPPYVTPVAVTAGSRRGTFAWP